MNRREHRKTGESGIGRRPMTPDRGGRWLARSKHRRLLLESLESRTLLAGDTLLITEFMAANDTVLADANGDYPDWIEIHNPTNTPVDLAGWYLSDDPEQLDMWPLPAVMLDAGAYMIVFASGQAADDYVDAAGNFHTNFKLSAGGESVLLVDQAQTVVHGFVDYLPQTADTSFGLLPDLVTEVYFTSPTPGGPADAAAQSVLITEIMYHSADESGMENRLEEYIELLNHGTAPVDLNGWRFSDGIDFVFSDVTIQPGEYLVVAADEAALVAKYPGVAHVLGDWTGRLSNSGESIELIDQSGVLIDRVRYADSGDWAQRRADPHEQYGWIWVAPHDGDGRSLELVNVDLSNAPAHNWQASAIEGGTPGASNSVAAADVAPAIVDVAYTPIIPKSTDEVTVSARLLDENRNAVTASLFWRVSTLNPGLFTEVPMLDDGSYGDGAAGDSVFAAVVPAQPDGTIVEFYVQAVDGGGLRRTSPGPTDDAGTQGANMLYQVADADWPIDVPVYRSIMTAQEWNTFQGMYRFSDAQMNATLVSTIGGITDVRHNVGIRYRGSGTRWNDPTNNRINIPSDRPWLDRTQININAFNPQNQVAGSTLFAMADLAAADAWPVRMLHNGTDLTSGGYYAHVAVLDADWSSQHFPQDSGGNVYRGRRAGEGPPGGGGAGLAYLGDQPGPYASYVKGSNASEGDWSDVIRLTDVLNNTPDETYFEELAQVVNIDQWLRTIAMIALSGYGEASLLTGDAGGDDYAMYRGIEDPRFQMVPYDLDAMFQGQNRSLFTATGVPALRRLLTDPEVLPRYYAVVLDLIDNVLTEEKIRPALERILGDVDSTNAIDGMVEFLDARSRFVRRLIPLELTVASDLPVTGGFAHTTEATSGALSGQAHAVRTRSVWVDGVAAAWDAFTATWSIADIPLHPGINHVLVQSVDAEGLEVDRTTIDIWRDSGTTQDVSGMIFVDTTWAAEAGPYRVLGAVAVAEGATLTIEPGTSVYFDAAAQLTVHGRLLAEGNEREWIRFTRVPGTDTSWNGIQFVDSNVENRIAYAVVEYGVTSNGMIGLAASRVELNHLLLDHTDRRRIQAINSAMIVRNSTFTDMFGPDEPPSTDNVSEQIYGTGIADGGHMIIENNWFGTTKGHNDVIDFSGPARPGPILQILDNTFSGSGDEILDLGGDAHIEGNLFQNVHKDQFNIDTGDANAISTGDDRFEAVITVVRNVFRDVDHAVYLKSGTFMFFENNTVIGIPDDTEEVEFSAINFVIPGRDAPGKGASLAGNIFSDIPQRVFGHVDQTASGSGSIVTDLEMHNTLVPPNRAADQVGNRSGTILDLGNGNFAADACLLEPMSDDRLCPGSPAVGMGPNSLDMGAHVPAGASIAGEPATRTAATSATLTVGGPGMTHYRFRFSDGAFGPEFPVDTPIAVSGLDDGAYQVAVIGRNSAGVWQDEANATFSRTWTVDQQLARVRISEVLARNVAAVPHEGTYPDLVELVNDGAVDVDLSGMGLSDTRDDPTKFIFPSPTVIHPGEYLVLFADSSTRTSGLHLGFGLNAEHGEGVFLFDTQAGGALVDSVEFGIQLADLSISRIGQDARWALSRPTLGSDNVVQPTSDWSRLKINEWLANPETIFADDFVELYNPSRLPVPLGGLLLTDNPAGWPDRSPVAPLSFIGGRGFTVFTADGDADAGADHVDFKLSSVHEMIGLLGADLSEIDKVIYYSQAPDVSLGRRPDGGVELASFSAPTPGRANPRPSLGSLSGEVPPGSLIYTSSADAAIESFDDVHDFTFTIDPGQTITVILQPDATLQPVVALLDPTGATLGTALAERRGDEVLIPQVATSGAGTYTVTISGAGGTIGEYSVRLILGAAVEFEEHHGPANDAMLSAQDIDASFFPLGVGSAERSAVLGRSSYFSNPRLVPDLNSTDRDRNPSISADGLTLLFNSNRPGGAGGNDLYMATRASTSDPFGNVINLGPGVNTASDEAAPALSADGLTLFFESDRAGGFGGIDLYMATRATASAPFGDVVNLGAGVNTNYADVSPSLSADGLALYFQSDRMRGHAGHDIFVATRSGVSDGFGNVVNLGAEINRSNFDAAPAISADGLTLLFESSGAFGGRDLYVATRPAESAPFGSVLNIGSGANSAGDDESPAVSFDREMLYFDSNRTGGLGDSDIYQAELESDWYRFTLADGQSAAVTVTARTLGNARVELYDRESNRIATGISAANVDQILNSFTDTTSDGSPDAYFIRVVGQPDEYHLLVTRDADFDTERHDELGEGDQAIGSAGTVLGALAARASGPDVDRYRIRANAGDSIRVATLLPADGAGQFVNNLDVAVELYDPNGALVASDPDGSLTHTAVLTGTYRVHLLAENDTSGEYVLNVTGPTGGLPPFQVTAIGPADGTRVPAAPTVQVDLSAPLRLPSLAAADLTVGGVAAIDVTVVDGDTLRFTLPPLVEGVNHVSIAAGALRNLQDQPVEAFTSELILDTVPPRVIGGSIQEGDVSPAGVPLVHTVQFDEELNGTDLDASDVQLVGQMSGVQLPTAFHYDAATSTLTLEFAGLPEDQYTLTLASGDGAFADLASNDLDGEPLTLPIPPNPSGDGMPGGDFVVHFTTDFGTVPYAVPPAPRHPRGALVYESSIAGTIRVPADDDRFVIELDDDQTITLVVATSASLQATVIVSDPRGVEIGTATAGAAGEDALIQTISTTGAGTYTVQVRGAGGTTGGYSATLILGAAVEMEEHNGPANNSIDLAQSIDGSFVRLGLGLAERGAVLGSRVTADAGDWYAFSLQDGQSATLALAADGQSDVGLELYDSASNLLALGLSAANANRLIHNFADVSTDGMPVTYFARVTGVTTDYSLVVTKNADFEAEPNSEVAGAPDITRTGTVLGHVTTVPAESWDPSSTVVTLPTDLVDGDGFLWDITSYATIQNGTSDAYDDGFLQYYSGPSGFLSFPSLSSAVSEDGGREIVLGPTMLNELEVVRKVYVPDDQGFARFLDIVTNTSASAAEYYLYTWTNLGSNEGTRLVGTSTGDESFDTNDDWLVTDDASDGSGDPTLLHVVRGPGGMRPLYAGLYGNDYIEFVYGLTLAPGETQIVMHFAAQNSDRATALAKAPQLAALERGALRGVSPSERDQIVNFLLDDIDHYDIQASAGDLLSLSTLIPGGGPGAFANDLDIAVELYDPSGALVAANSDGSLTHVAAVTGAYTVRVLSEDTTFGEYVLSVSGHTGGSPPLRVAATDPVPGARLVAAPTMRIDLSGQLLLTSVDASDLTVGGVAATGVAVIDGDTLRFTLPPLAEGVSDVAIAAGALRNAENQPIEAFASQLILDSIPPRVIDSSVQDGDAVPAGVPLVYTVRFDEGLMPWRLDAADVLLAGQTSGAHRPTAFNYDAATSTLTLEYAGLPEDSYTLTLISADGAFEDTFGNDLDGEPVSFPVPPHRSGDGVPGGSFLVHFTTEFVTAPFPLPLTAQSPRGSLIYNGSVGGAIGVLGDEDRFTIDVDDGQTVTVVVGTDSPLKVEVDLHGPGGAAIGSATAAAPGGDAVLQTVATVGAGTYVVTLRGANGTTTGGYTARVILNAAVEMEEHNTSGNDSMSAAEDLDASFLPLGVAAIERGAVLGALAPYQTTSLGANVNAPDNDLGPTLSADGLTLLFSSNRSGGAGGDDLYMATRIATSEPFRDVVNLGPGVNTASDETGPALSADGLTLYFGSNREGGAGGTDLYMATRPTTADLFGNVTSLGPGINTQGIDNNPTISADGLMLMFNSNQSGGFGGQDLYMATRATTTDPFGNGRRLGAEVNSSANESGPSLSADGLSVYFNSNRPGGSGGQDLYLATRNSTSEPFGVAAGLGTAVNTSNDDRAPNISYDGEIILFESDRPGGEGRSDLYQAQAVTDWYRFTLADGQAATLALAQLTDGNVTLALYGSNQSLLATAIETDRLGALINNFADTTVNGVADTYFVRVVGAFAHYSLVVTRDADFDTEPNNALSSETQDITHTGSVLGALGSSVPPIDVETEPNDDGLLGSSIGDLSFANDLSGSFIPAGNDQFQATVTGEISAGNDVDWDFFRILAGPGDTLTVELRGQSSGAGTLGDPYLWLFDRAGTQLASNDDYASAESLLQFGTFGYTGDYYIVADSYSNWTGTYTLTVTLATPAPPAGIVTDDDFYSVAAVAGDSLVISTLFPASGPGEFGNHLDVAIDLYDPSGALVASDPDGAFAYPVKLTGTYTMRVFAENGTSGEYLLNTAVIAKGDMNLDGNVDFEDINGFAMALANPTHYEATHSLSPSLNGDLDGDGDLDFDDIDEFVSLLSMERLPRQLHQPGQVHNRRDGDGNLRLSYGRTADHIFAGRSDVGSRLGRDRHGSAVEHLIHHSRRSPRSTKSWPTAADQAFGADVDWIG